MTGLSKALHRKGHLVEIILPKYDCMEYDRICDLRVIFSYLFFIIIKEELLMLALRVWVLLKDVQTRDKTFFTCKSITEWMWLNCFPNHQRETY